MSGAEHTHPHTHPSPCFAWAKPTPEQVNRGPGGWGCYLHICLGVGVGQALGVLESGAAQLVQDLGPLQPPACCLVPPPTCLSVWPVSEPGNATGTDSRPRQQVKGGKAAPCIPLLQPTRGSREPLAVPQPPPPSLKLGARGLASLTWEVWAGAARSVTVPTSGCRKGFWEGLQGGGETWGVASGGERGFLPENPSSSTPPGGAGSESRGRGPLQARGGWPAGPSAAP